MNVMTSGRIQFANANNIPAINRYLILLFDKHNENADIANARNGISVPAGSTAMIFEYVKQNIITAIYAVRFEKNLLAKNHTFHNIHIFNIRLIK